MAKRKAKPIHRRRTKGVDRFVGFIAFVEFIGFGESIGFGGFVGFIAFIGSIGFVVFACPAVAGLSSLRSSSSVEHKAGYRMRDAECGMQDSGCRMQDSGFRIQDAGFRIQDTGWNILSRSVTPQRANGLNGLNPAAAGQARLNRLDRESCILYRKRTTY